MSELQLVIGDKSLSSWSMRAWLGVKQSGLAFKEVMIPLDRPDTKNSLAKFSPSHKVPCLIHGDLRVWDSLAICEYVAELAPEKNLWPQDQYRRAIARSYVAEMHSGFQSMRSQLSMDLQLKMQIRHLSPETISEIARIVAIWELALATSKGPFLFGSFGIADAFYAPVVFRFLSYGIKFTSKPANAYMNTIQEYPIVREWVTAALEEKPQPVILSGAYTH